MEKVKVSGLLLQFALDHPCGTGHFPGNPIIPGALLLDEVLNCIARSMDLSPNGTWQVKSAKFPQPVRPGDSVHISYAQIADGQIRFECTVSNYKVMLGIAQQVSVDGVLP